MLKNAIKFSISTELRDEGSGTFTVYDVMTFESGRIEEIKRFEGSQVNAARVQKEVGEYWKSALNKAPPSK